jgi:hypothetical protein
MSEQFTMTQLRAISATLLVVWQDNLTAPGAATRGANCSDPQLMTNYMYAYMKYNN